MLQQYDLGTSTADGLMVWLEISERDPVSFEPSSMEILSKAREIYDGRIFGVVFGDTELKPLYKEAFSYGADTLYHVKDKRLIDFHPEAYCESLRSIAERINPSIILMSATLRGREVAPRLAASLGAGLTADCTELSMDGSVLQMTRPAFGGDLMATITSESMPQMATVRPGTFPPNKISDDATGTVIYWQYKGDSFKTIISSKRKYHDEKDITEADILISLGNGIKSKDTIRLAESVAKKLGGMVSCSRALVEKGWFPQSRQVGQSGRNVSPEIYLAFGISGSVQHKAGIMTARRVIAVNSDPDAPIREIADELIVGDAENILRELDKIL
ncbi:MAG: electron transfer flavoprotein subunit alpha/FixB family protein [Candidatus Methanoplasma sp.]|jgi:electron transfer flavoprotein alpha subunit|nr:electron transfer flavoprotein subunit alpha/FixB family protein [Candidatus Methanoplasma sp.]